MDIAARIGAPVIAAADGVVRSVDFDPSVGFAVRVEHVNVHSQHGEDWQTFYIHLGSVAVRPGQIVRRGELLGTVGMFYHSGGMPHVHFELCWDRCAFPHVDGDLEGTEDPERYLVGCFDHKRVYASAQLVLTAPIEC